MTHHREWREGGRGATLLVINASLLTTRSVPVYIEVDLYVYNLICLRLWLSFFEIGFRLGLLKFVTLVDKSM